ncbi:MAG: SPOR domain-containing protein [Bacillota bacterium]
MQRGMKIMSEFVTKLVGVVFFSLLAIGLGVLFGYMFKEILNENPEKGTIVQGELENLPVDEEMTTPDKIVQPETPPLSAVKYRVLIGNYSRRDQALSIADKLLNQGYPVYVPNQAPYKVQVGAFANRTNAEALKTELVSKGYKPEILEY